MPLNKLLIIRVRPMQYRSEATSVEGFVQQIACCYLRHGYWWYVTGSIPPHKDPQAVDCRIIEKYDIAVSESTRARRKRLGCGNLQYIRFERFFAIIATKGKQRFYEEEANSIRDIRRIPLRFAGYSISCRRGSRKRTGEADDRWHAHVKIERRRYLELKDHFLELATHRSAMNLALAFYRFPFEPYAPVRRQMLNILRAVNRARTQAGYGRIPTEVLPFRRRVVKPFDPASRLAPRLAALSDPQQGVPNPAKVLAPPRPIGHGEANNAVLVGRERDTLILKGSPEGIRCGPPSSPLPRPKQHDS